MRGNPLAALFRSRVFAVVEAYLRMSGGRKAAGVVGAAVLGSRLMGLVREVVFAGLFGAGRNLDAFLAAFQIPNLLRDLFAEGALSTAFTATFAKTQEREGVAAAWRLTSRLLSTMTLFLGAICLLGIAVSPWLVHVTNYGFHDVPGKFDLAVRLTRLLFPFILLVSLAAVAMGVLNARFIFGLPASASTAFNVVSVAAGVALAYAFDPQADWRRPFFGERALYGVCLGVLLGGFAQLAIQWPVLRRQGYFFRWDPTVRDVGLRQVWRLMWPSVIAGAAVQINVVVNGMFASEINGARSWLNCAFRLMQFPIGVFGVAIATVTLPAVARHHARGDLPAIGWNVEQSLRLAIFLTLPAAAGLFALAPDLIGLIYQRHLFTAFDTARTAAALRGYAAGLCGYAVLKVLTPCFYALDHPRTPLNVSLIGIGINLGLNLILFKWLGFGHVGLAMTTSCVALLNSVQLAVRLKRLVCLGGATRWIRFLGSVLMAACACGWAAAWTVEWASAWVVSDFKGRLISVAAGVGAGMWAYGLTVLLLRVPECMDMLRWAWRRIGTVRQMAGGRMH